MFQFNSNDILSKNDIKCNFISCFMFGNILYTIGWLDVDRQSTVHRVVEPWFGGMGLRIYYVWHMLNIHVSEP